MLQWLIQVLTPIFTKMGVSEVDVQTYVNSLSGYIYAILGSLLLVIAIMVGAHFFVKRGKRHVVRWSAGLAWVLLVAVLANVISFGPMYNNLSIILNSKASVSEEATQTSREVIRRVGEEGLVLLENDGLVVPSCLRSTVTSAVYPLRTVTLPLQVAPPFAEIVSDEYSEEIPVYLGSISADSAAIQVADNMLAIRAIANSELRILFLIFCASHFFFELFAHDKETLYCKKCNHFLIF